MSKVLVSTKDKSRHDLLQYPFPKRVVRRFAIFISGVRTEVATTRGQRYTYMMFDGVGYYVNGLLPDEGRYKLLSL